MFIIEVTLKVIFTINNLVSSFATLTSTINNSVLSLKITNIFPLLNCILYIYYLVQFKKNLVNILALINSDSKVNTKTLVYASKTRLFCL